MVSRVGKDYPNMFHGPNRMRPPVIWNILIDGDVAAPFGYSANGQNNEAIPCDLGGDRMTTKNVQVINGAVNGTNPVFEVCEQQNIQSRTALK
jgi:hypothetical protein